jgi:hypothetical protein
VSRQIRAAWNELVRFERYLGRPELRELSRADFLPGADAAAVKRAEAARQLFAGIPAQIFEGRQAPQHSRRRNQLTEKERALLREISATLLAEEAEEPARPPLAPAPFEAAFSTAAVEAAIAGVEQ